MNEVASGWSDVDDATLPQRLVIGLDRLRADPFFIDQKARLRADLEVEGDERIVDVGCGTGEDAVDLARIGCTVVGIERSAVMAAEARRRSSAVSYVVADTGRLPLRSGAFDRVRVDRVLQHLRDGAGAAREWRRVLRRDGVVAIFEPDLTTARIDGLDATAAEAVCRWRAHTRPGAASVTSLREVLEAAALRVVRLESTRLELDDLDRADGIMGLVDWGEAAARAGVLDPAAGRRWRDDARAASRCGALRYSCDYVLATARAI